MNLEQSGTSQRELNMSKTKRKVIKASNIWRCLVCAEKPEFEHEEMMQHLRSIHQIDTKNSKAKRSMLMHIDDADYFTFGWEWEIGAMKFIQHTTTPRHKSDLMSM